MAQFVEVMKQARRICLEHPGDCHGCPLHDDEGLACRFYLNETYFYDDGTERIVLKWAEEHPERVYPSWDEAWNALYPDAYDKRVPCLRYFLPHDKYVELCEKINGRCYKCRQQPIPAEIAEKLGIRPKEVLNDAEVH